MRRRDVVRGLSMTALAATTGARAQSSSRPVVGLVFTPGAPERMPGPNPASPPARAFVHGLRDLGWIDGETIRIERLTASAEPGAALRQFAALRALGSRVNALAGARWIQDAAIQAAPEIPVVTLFHEDPVAADLVSSLGRPVRPITGVTSATGPELDGKRIQFLREVLPSARRIAFLGPRHIYDQFRPTAPSTITLVSALVDRLDQYDAAFAAMRDGRAEAVLASAGPVNYRGFPEIVRRCVELRLPCIYAVREAVDGGGLMSYGPSIPEAFRQMAGMTHRILRGEKAGEIAVEQPTKFELVVNTGVAKSLGLTLPSSLVAFATDVIE